MNAGELDQSMDAADGKPEALSDPLIRQAFVAQPQDLLFESHGPFRSAHPDASRPRGGQAGLRALADQTALELRHRHQHSELQTPDRVVVGGVDSLVGADERHIEPAQLVEDHRQMHQRAPDAVELVDDHGVAPAGAHGVHESLPVGASVAPARCLLPVNCALPDPPTTPGAIAAEFALLGVDSLLVGGNAKIKRRSQGHPP